MQSCTRRTASLACSLERGSLAFSRASPRYARRRCSSLLPQTQGQTTFSYGASQLSAFSRRSFATSTARYAKRNTAQVSEKSSQDTLLSAIESKVGEYQNAVKQVSSFLGLRRVVLKVCCSKAIARNGRRDPDQTGKDCERARTARRGMAGIHRCQKRKFPCPLYYPRESADRVNLQAMAEAETLLQDSDPAMRSLASEELAGIEEQMSELLRDRLPALLLPPSSTASLGAMIELKAGVGGDEAALFVEQVMRMYLRYAQSRGWRTEILSKTAGSIGTGAGTGLKDVTIKIDGEGAFGDFRFERGVHRVQRVPATESAGRVHTSTIAVVVRSLSHHNMSRD
jgi:hypothetical protein